MREGKRVEERGSEVKGRERRRDGVSAVVHAVWVGGLHFGGHVGGRNIDLSDGGLPLALAASGDNRGGVRDDRGDFLDQKVCG
jgi:hypothetical protein